MIKILEKFKEHTGITIVETLVSLMVVSLGLIPALSVLTSSINIAARIRNNLIAANLAQEGIEVARSLRDANWFLNKTNFYDDMIGLWEVGYNTSWNNPPTFLASVTNARFIKFNTSTGLYNYAIGQDTIFKRSINISLSPNPCNCELVVVSRIDWTERTISKSIQVESHLYDWR
jgi:type II secretory pathway pseudopilin PulG